jgi:hypothetical protein
MLYSKWKRSTPNQILSSPFSEAITEGDEMEPFIGEVSLSAMNLLFPTPQKSEDLIPIYLHGLRDFYQ